MIYDALNHREQYRSLHPGPAGDGRAPSAGPNGSAPARKCAEKVRI